LLLSLCRNCQPAGVTVVVITTTTTTMLMMMITPMIAMLAMLIVKMMSASDSLNTDVNSKKDKRNFVRKQPSFNNRINV